MPNLDAAVDHPHGERAHDDRSVLQAPTGSEIEVLFVDRGGDDELTLDVADDAPRQHGRVAEWVEGIDREDAGRPREAKHRHLVIADERPDTHIGQEGVELAYGGPGGLQGR